MYSLVLMATMSVSGTESAAWGGSWYNTCTLDMCLPIRYGWKPYSGCIPNYAAGFLGNGYGWGMGCDPCGSGGYGRGLSYGGLCGFGGDCGYGGGYGSGYGGGYGMNCCGCYGSGLAYWQMSAGYPAVVGTGNYGAYGTYSMMNPSQYYSGMPLPYNGISPLNAPSMKPLEDAITPFKTPLNTPTTTPEGTPLVPSLGMPKQTKYSIEPQKDFASIVLQVPENAHVFVDGKLMKSGSSRRVFTTPKIETNQEYYYQVVVVVEKNGKKIKDSQKVIVRGGERTSVSFANLNSDSPVVVGNNIGR